MGQIIAIDWGTTNRRAYLIAEDGSIMDQISDGKGVRSTQRSEYPNEIAELRARFGSKPVLCCGMVGADIGWHAAPYVDCPATPEGIAKATLRLEADNYIVPGVSFGDASRPDVMRGEEVQAFGAIAAGHIAEAGLICNPGTHTKWISVRGGAIVYFTTMMTGELFALLSDHSILASDLRKQGFDEEAFGQGVAIGLSEGNWVQAAFSIRAARLLGRGYAQASSFLSGLLIGADVGIATRKTPFTRVSIMGRDDLSHMYSLAVERAGLETQKIDGAESFVAGAVEIWTILARNTEGMR